MFVLSNTLVAEATNLEKNIVIIIIINKEIRNISIQTRQGIWIFFNKRLMLQEAAFESGLGSMPCAQTSLPTYMYVYSTRSRYGFRDVQFCDVQVLWGTNCYRYLQNYIIFLNSRCYEVSDLCVFERSCIALNWIERVLSAFPVIRQNQIK